jgi:hypothetical protein
MPTCNRLTSQDDEFREKRDDVLRVYYEAPADEHVICVDEKTGIQALERGHPDQPMVPGQVVRREFEYIRHGTLTWMGAFDVRRGPSASLPRLTTPIPSSSCST